MATKRKSTIPSQNKGGLPEIPTAEPAKSLLPAESSRPSKLYSQQMEAYGAWQKQPSPETLAPLLKTLAPLLETQVAQYKGTLSPVNLMAEAKKHSIRAIKSYDPTQKVKLTTHISNSLKSLHRENYKAQSALRLSEELQRAMGTYREAVQYLTNDMGRTPTAQELADTLSWPISKISRLDRQTRNEVSLDDVLFAGGDPDAEAADPRVDYVYYDLTPVDKLIMEWKTGYGGKEMLSAKEIAKRLKVSESAISQRSLLIAKKLKDVVGL